MKIKILFATLMVAGGCWLLASGEARAQEAGRETITNKLHHIRFEAFVSDGLPLVEVVRELADQTRKHDPEKKGINFLLNPNPPPSAPSVPILDPQTGMPIRAAELEQVDISSVIIRIPTPLNEISLADALDAIVLTADHPLQYAVENYGVVLSLKGTPPVSVAPEPRPSPQDIEQFPPVVIKTVPEAGSTEVAAGETEIRVTFSKDMTDQGWSWVPAWRDAAPLTPGEIHFEADHRTCVLKVTLQPGKAYGWWLNNAEYHGFQDVSHRPAVPYLLAFVTGKQMGGAAAPAAESLNSSPSRSPAIAPGEKPDSQKISDDARLRSAASDAEAKSKK